VRCEKEGKKPHGIPCPSLPAPKAGKNDCHAKETEEDVLHPSHSDLKVNHGCCVWAGCFQLFPRHAGDPVRQSLISHLVEGAAGQKVGQANQGHEEAKKQEHFPGVALEKRFSFWFGGM